MLKTIKARKRRASQTILERLGKAEACVDEQFESLAAFFCELEREVRKLWKKGEVLRTARIRYGAEAAGTLQAFADHFAHRPEHGGERPNDASRAAAAAAAAAQEMQRHLEDYAAPLEEAHTAAFFDDLLKVRFPAIKTSIREWRRLRTDYDSYTRRHQAALVKAQKRQDRIQAKAERNGTDVRRENSDNDRPEASPEVIKLAGKLAATSDEFAQLDVKLKAQLREMRDSRRDLLLSCWANVICSHGDFVQGSSTKLWDVMHKTIGKPRAALAVCPLAALPAARRALGLAPSSPMSVDGASNSDWTASLSEESKAIIGSIRHNDNEITGKRGVFDDSTGSIEVSVPTNSSMEDIISTPPAPVAAVTAADAVARISPAVPALSESDVSEDEAPVMAPRSWSASCTSLSGPMGSDDVKEDDSIANKEPAPTVFPKTQSTSRTSPPVPTDSEDDGVEDASQLS